MIKDTIRVQGRMENVKTCKGKNVACNIIWNLLLLRRLQLHIFTSCNSHLTFLTLGGGGEFFSCLPFISRNILSAYWRWPTFSIFFFKNAEWAGNFVVHSPEVSLKIISFRHLFRLPVWNFGHLRGNRMCLWQPGAHLAAALNQHVSQSNIFS